MSKGWVEPFGDGVRRLREQRGWTQYELGQRAGVSQSVIRDVEHAGKNGNYEPRNDTVRGIVYAFGDEGLDLLREIGRAELADHLAENQDDFTNLGSEAGLSPREAVRFRVFAQELIRAMIEQSRGDNDEDDGSES